jgi:hypothetical protein
MSESDQQYAEEGSPNPKHRKRSIFCLNLVRTWTAAVVSAAVVSASQLEPRA